MIESIIAYWQSYAHDLGMADGTFRLFLMIFPFFLVFEVPLNVLIILGVGRWFLRMNTLPPKQSLYTPKVSCLITCYSEGLDVQKTLLSLCEQIYAGEIEMIPIIDGATANKVTMDAVRAVNVDKERYPRRFLRPIAKWQRGGRVSSLNAGLSLATGEIIMALDGDTSFDNDMVSTIVRHFEDPKVPAVSGSLRVRNVWASMTTAVQALEYLLSIHLSKVGLAEFNIVNNISGAFGCFRRSFLEKIGGWDTHTAEDLDTTLRIKQYFKREGLRIPFEPRAVGHTDSPTTFKQYLMQRLRWDGDLFFIYMRKHRHAIQPRLIGWRNFLMTAYAGLFFQLVLPFIIFGYMVAVLFLLPPGQIIVLTAMVYALYVAATALMYLLSVVLVSERPKQDLKLAPLVLVFPAVMFVMRCWSGLAMLNDAFRRGHEETSMAPWWVLKRAKKF
ncbi:glycosyltransferase family 2 protein [Pseudomonas sp. CFBP 13719]|uniref:glycosyltransferase family 2 protein n=1 Tax=Pseudomonas sp. CFBP 13719 TaxID=2775303 RepID=UPI000F01B440|nr:MULTISPECIES: glycosyltransferase [Pseudomonas]MBD8615442.1 glycosyltransferase family 2 protein [Pseudomonas putida]MBD8681905.1 glycosyltransferase family 2 protein [Pseudomonas sp. CFBP 13719]